MEDAKSKSRQYSLLRDLHGINLEGIEAPTALTALEIKARSVSTTVSVLVSGNTGDEPCMEAGEFHGPAITFNFGTRQDPGHSWLHHSSEGLPAAPRIPHDLRYRKISLPHPESLRFRDEWEPLRGPKGKLSSYFFLCRCEKTLKVGSARWQPT